jgi:hypothetical protein
MTDLSKFSAEEIELLASLPYKVGMLISHADDQDGEADDERESKVLATCLRQFAKMNEDKPLVALIMKESLRREDKWVEWADQSFQVTNDIKKAVPVLRQKSSVEEIKALKRCLMEIGTAVAQAFGEFGAFDEAETEGFFGKIIGKFAALGDGDAGHPMNVSAAEDSTLEKLRAVLQGKA